MADDKGFIVKGFIEDGQILCVSQMCMEDCYMFYKCKKYYIIPKEITNEQNNEANERPEEI